MLTEHSFIIIDIYSTLLRVSFLLFVVELHLSTLNKPISDQIRTTLSVTIHRIQYLHSFTFCCLPNLQMCV